MSGSIVALPLAIHYMWLFDMFQQKSFDIFQKATKGRVENMKKKKTIMIIIGIVAVLVIIYVVAALTGNLKTTENDENSSSILSSAESIASSSNSNDTFGWEPSKATTEEGTSARVDEILLRAKEDVQNISEPNAETLWTEAINYLKEHCNNFYESNEIMEKSMYYGTFLHEYIEENAAATNISELPDSTRAAYDAGYNSVKAIKYVYRGAEKIEDESTQSALTEAQTALKKFR